MSTSLEGLRSLLNLAKQAPPEKADDEFYELMLKAKDLLGQTSYHIAAFYYEYANFLLGRIEKNLDIFNTAAVPAEIEEADEAAELENIPQDYEDSHAEQNQEPEENGEAEPAAGESALPKEEKPEEEAVEEDIDDKEICYCNLEWAINIYEGELQKLQKGEPAQGSLAEVLDGLRRARTRLGDLYLIDEDYQKSIAQYRKVIEQEAKREGSDTNRMIAQLHYLIGNSLMYENAPGCEVLALKEYIQAVVILVNHLSIKEQYDTVDFDLPTSEHYKVDRFAYLSKPQDSEKVKEIKDVISCLLDRIEDTHDQIGQREGYQAEKQKAQQEKKMGEFKPVPEEAKIVHLGSFGNRKRKPESIPQSSPASKEETPETVNQPTSQAAERAPEAQQ